MTIVGLHFQWLELRIKSHGLAGKLYVFSCQKAKKATFSETGWNFKFNLVDALKAQCVIYF